MPPLVNKAEEDKISTGLAMPCPVNANTDQKKSATNTKLVSCYRSSGSISVPQTPTKNFVTFQLVKASSSTFDSLKEELKRRRSGITTKKRPPAFASAAKDPPKQKVQDAVPPNEGQCSSGTKIPESEASSSLLAGALLNAAQVAKAITDFEDSQTARADSRNSENSDNAQTKAEEAEQPGQSEEKERKDRDARQLHKFVSDCGNDSHVIRIEQGKEPECDRTSQSPVVAKKEEEKSQAKGQDLKDATIQIVRYEKVEKEQAQDEKEELEHIERSLASNGEKAIEETTSATEKEVPHENFNNKPPNSVREEMLLNPEKAETTKAEDLSADKEIGTKSDKASSASEEKRREANGETAQLEEQKAPPREVHETEMAISPASSLNEGRASGSTSLALSHADSTWLEVADEAAIVTRRPTTSELSHAAQATTEACESALRLDAATKPIIRLCHPDEAAVEQKRLATSLSSSSTSSAIDENAQQLQLLRSTTRRPPASTRRRSSAALSRFSRSLSSSSEASTSTCPGSDSDQQDADVRRKPPSEEAARGEGDDGVAARSCKKHSKCHCYLFALDTLGLYSILH